MQTAERAFFIPGDAVGVGLARLDAQEVFREVNATLCRQTLCRREELTGFTWRACIDPIDGRRVEAAFASARQGESTYAEVRGLRLLNGASRHFGLHITPIGAGSGLSGFFCVLLDLDSYKASQGPLALAVEVAPSGLIITNPEGRILMVNQAVESLFGYSRAQLVGENVETLLPLGVRTQHRDHRERISSNPVRPMSGRDLRGRRRDGVEIPLQVFVNFLDTADGKMVLCTIIDIAERVRYEEQLELARAAAEAANSAKSDFLARMSHEIRTPMNLIMGMNSLLRETELNDRQRQYVDVSGRNVRRLLRLINGILDLSKVEAGMVSLESRPFSVEELMNEAVAVIETAAEKKGILLHAVIDAKLHRFWKGDPERIHQILLNVTGNAIKFTAEGAVTICAAPAVSEDGRAGIRFTVTDTGCGICPEHIEKVFEVFHQADGKLNRQHEGSGLGLAISRHLCALMGGEIHARGGVEHGAVVEFTIFPERADEGGLHTAQAEAAADEPTVELVRGARILVAEDNQENSLLIQAYLEGLPLSLEFASDGVEAIEKVKTRQFDLVFMDIQMPKLDGYQAARRIRDLEQSRPGPRVPIVTLSAHALVEAHEESVEAGCDGHVTKPVERRDLLAAIARYAPVGRRQKAQDLRDKISASRPAFLNNRVTEIALLRAALDSHDLAGIMHIGHNVKGMSRGYGFPEIGRAGAELEAAGAAGDLLRLQAAVAQFAETVENAAP